MAIAFLNGHLTRTPFFKEGDSTNFAACTVKETYVDRNGEERVAGYHDVIAFDENAQRLALFDEGDEINLKANIRYRADKRFVNVDNDEKNPFTAQFVLMEVLSSRSQDNNEDEDPFAGA